MNLRRRWLRFWHGIIGHSFRVVRSRRVHDAVVVRPDGVYDGGIYERFLRCKCGCEAYRVSIGWYHRGHFVHALGEEEDIESY